MEEKAVRNLSRTTPAHVEAVRNTRIAAARNSILLVFFFFQVFSLFHLDRGENHEALFKRFLHGFQLVKTSLLFFTAFRYSCREVKPFFKFPHDFKLRILAAFPIRSAACSAGSTLS